MSTFKCIKPACGNSYESTEEEAYYCPSCVEANKVIAAQVDAKLSARPRKQTKSDWQIYEESAKIQVQGLSGVQIKI